MTPAAVQAAYERALSVQLGSGEMVRLVRKGDAETGCEAEVRARVTDDFKPSELAGAVEQGRRNAIVLASDVIASGFPLPFKVNHDRLVWRSDESKTDVIKNVATRRVGGHLIAYVLDLQGG